MKKNIRILLIDDHPMLRQALGVILDAATGMEVVRGGISLDGLDAMNLAASPSGVATLQGALTVMAEEVVDLAVIDFSLGDEVGSDVARALLSQYPNLKILAISSTISKANIRAMVKAGATGFVLKNADVRELLDAVRATASGENFFSRNVSTILLDDLLKGKPITRPPRYQCAPSDLTARELDVLQEIVGEYTTKEIADRLHISSKTVEFHRQNLMLKIGARNTAGLVKFALQYDLIE